MSKIFDEENMRQVLSAYVPNGETLLAGIHAISKETNVVAFFENCICKEDRLIPSEKGDTVVLNKKKYLAYDIYLGITKTSLIISECEKNKYYYQIENVPNNKSTDVKKITSELLFTDIEMCYSFSDIKSCEIKKGWMGSIKCFITMKNGSYFKLLLPKLGGVGGNMPHHTEYRDVIIAKLNETKI